MKQILPLLLCYVLMTSQVFAISGGPVYGRGTINPVGTYSGLIQINRELDNDNPVIDPRTGAPVLDPNTGLPVPSTVANPNAIGLFSLGVPSTNVARGAALIFVEGIVYTGTITGSVDIDNGKLSGIVNATYQYTLNTGTTSVQITAQANGKINAQVTASAQGASSSARLNGTSTIQIANGGVSGLRFIVDRTLQCTITGFRQSTTPSTVTTLTTT